MDKKTKDELLKQVTRSHRWLLDTIDTEELNADIANHSDDLKHAKMVQKILDIMEKEEKD